jgi:uncharacterized protein (TIGR04255 family)
VPFPESDRVVYGKNPLADVICQLKFPAVLRITSEAPSVFQDLVRDRFPVFREIKQDLSNLNLPENVAKVFSERIGIATSELAYNFLTGDERLRVALARDFIALSDRGYRTWGEFRSYLDPALSALTEVYGPAFFERVGLRYRDIIVRSRLGLEDAPWRDLLTPHIAGELTNDAMAGAMKKTIRQLTVKLLDKPGWVQIQHGLGTADYGDGRKEEVYVIDADFYLEGQIASGDAHATLDYFNRRAGHLFRWCISERLHESMEPTKI